MTYTLGRNAAETARLRRQADELRDQSCALLDRLDLPPAAHAVDLGCGPAGILDLLAERVGPAGRVLGVDQDPRHVALAREFACAQGLDNVEVVEGDVRHLQLADASFDLVHARTVLVNVPRPAELVAEMARVAKPGGYVALEEPDVGLALFQPSDPALHALRELFLTVYRADGADPLIGRRLPELLREAGLDQVGVEPYAQLFPVGHTRRTLLPDLVRSLRPKILGLGLCTEPELDRLDRAARAQLQDARVLVMTGFFIAWACRPNPPAGQRSAGA